MKLYLSGPMTGIEEHNYPAFHAAKEELENAGHEVLSPAELPVRDDWEWIDYMMIDIEWVFAAEGVAHLSGWEKSKGARIEMKIAECRGLLIKHWTQWLS